MLPIDGILPELTRTLAKTTTALLQAPPGAGKTTRVPLALLDAPWRDGRKILMLEPRRLAARSAARPAWHRVARHPAAPRKLCRHAGPERLSGSFIQTAL